MSKYKKAIHGGRYHAVVTYSAATKKDSPKARAEKRNHSTRAQQVINDKNSLIMLSAILAENFTDSKTAFFVTPSFDEAHYPNLNKTAEYWNFCVNEAKLYCKRLARLAQRRGHVLKYAYSVGVGEGGRWHLHMLIDGVTDEDIRDVWGRGVIDYHHLYGEKKWFAEREWMCQTNNVNCAAIAKYMMHNARSRLVGQHPWHVSRSCTRPKVEKAVLVPNNESIEPPEGSEILGRETSELLYSTYQFIEYIEPSKKPEKRTRRKKKPTADRQ